MKLLLIGLGVVGQGFAEVLRDKAAALKRRAQFQRANHRRGGRLARARSIARRGLDIAALLAAAESGDLGAYPKVPGLRRDLTPDDMIAAGDADVLIEASPTNLQTAQPALAYCHQALDAGMHLALANKGPVALDYANLMAKARDESLQVRCEATVMAGTPAMRLAEDALAVCSILSARGILNGTTNYILTQMESGMAYGDALAQAQALGYAETDPSGDVEGWDAAGKALILANALFGRAAFR